MIQKITLLITLLLSYGYSNQAEITSKHDYQILENYFVKQFTHEGFYYTLVGEKPITAYNDYDLDNIPIALIVENSVPYFLNTVMLKQFLPIWEKLALKQDKFVFKSVPSTPGEKIYLGYENMFINISSLKKVIEENLFLFKYILGPTLTVDDLVNRIAYSPEKLSESIGYNKILEGIVLGFGTQNSIVGGRLEQISAFGFSKDLAPFYCKSNSLGEMKDVFVINFLETVANNKIGVHTYQGDQGKLKPSYGFETIEDEILSCEALYEKLPDSLNENKPRFVFGAYKGDGSNPKFFERLLATQKQAQEFIKQSDFLEQVLEKIHGEKVSLKFDKNSPIKSFKASLDDETWVYVLQQKAKNYTDKIDQKLFLSSFISADNEKKQINTTNIFVEEFNRGKSNFLNANEIFEKLSHDASLKEILPKKLYYKIITAGEGPELAQKRYVRLGYTVTNFKNQILSANQECWINLTYCLPSFEHGLQGMRVGEEREIYIHPLLGYGLHTSLPLYTELKINVKLFEIDHTVSKPLSEIKAHSSEYIENPAFLTYLKKFDNFQNPSVAGSFYRRMFESTEVSDRAKVLHAIDKLIKDFT